MAIKPSHSKVVIIPRPPVSNTGKGTVNSGSLAAEQPEPAAAPASTPDTATPVSTSPTEPVSEGTSNENKTEDHN